jgi:predicted MFS family arabinose efflux permease
VTRDFRVLWTAGLVSDIGDWLLLVALPVLVYQLTGSTLGTAVAFLAELAPPVLLGSVAGRLADRWDRRRALVWISVAQALALLPLLAVGGRRDLWLVYTVIMVQSGLAALFDPSKNALLPTLVGPGDLMRANSLLAVNSNLGRLVGGPLGGLLLAVGGLHTIVAVDAVSFAVAAALIVRLRPAAAAPAARADAPEAAAPDRRKIRAGLVMTGVAAVAQGLFVVLFVPFVARALHGDAAEIGLLRGVQAVGAIAAGLLLGVVARRVRPGALAALGAAGFGVLGLAIWNAPWLTTAEALYVALFVAVGAPGTIMVTGLVTVLQECAPAASRGRVFGAFTTAFALGQAVGMAGGGLLGDRVGVVPLLNAQAGLYLVAALVAAVGLRAGRQPPVRIRQHAVAG